MLPLGTYKRFTDKNLEEEFDPDDDLSPCGLKAKYLFTDSFQLFGGEVEEDGSKSVNVTSQIEIDERNIAHSVDRDAKFKKADNGKQWLDVTNGKSSKQNERDIMWFGRALHSLESNGHAERSQEALRPFEN